MRGFKFQGTFGIASEKNNQFEYLYIGKGKLLQKNGFKIEAVHETVTAELKLENGTYYYSSNKPVLISIDKGKSKQYPAGYNVKIK
jgi:hypothetical protein